MPKFMTDLITIPKTTCPLFPSSPLESDEEVAGTGKQMPSRLTPPQERKKEKALRFAAPQAKNLSSAKPRGDVVIQDTIE